MHQAIQLLGVQPQAIGQLLPGSLKKHQARLRNPTGDCGFVRLIRAPHLSEAQSVDEMKAKNFCRTCCFASATKVGDESMPAIAGTTCGSTACSRVAMDCESPLAQPQHRYRSAECTLASHSSTRLPGIIRRANCATN